MTNHMQMLDSGRVTRLCGQVMTSHFLHLLLCFSYKHLFAQSAENLKEHQGKII